jgi:carboxyl-terminal processing protease
MNRSYVTQSPPIAENLKLAVLIDEYSASASEIVAGSLQDLDKAVIIGNTSFGKGLVQQTKPVSFGGQIKLTVAKYYTPSGRCIQKLDYSSMQGSSKKIEDSLVKKFKTKNGREVTDSRAVEPDIKVEPEYFSAITEKLILKDVIFDFVNQNIAFYDSSSLSPNTFMLTDSAYSSFMKLAQTKNLNYETESSFKLKELKKTAKKEKYIVENEEVFVLLDSIFKSNINIDLEKNREEIQFFIENEMIAREYFQNGRMEASIKKDPYTQKANTILNNQSEYNKILGNFK